MSPQHTIADCVRLLELADLIQNTAKVIINQWAVAEERPVKSHESESAIASPALFNAQKTLLSAAGLLTELVSDPSSRLLEVSSQYNEARALHIAAELRVADIIAKSPDQRASIQTLSEATGIERRKLGMWTSPTPI